LADRDNHVHTKFRNNLIELRGNNGLELIGPALRTLGRAVPTRSAFLRATPRPGYSRRSKSITAAAQRSDLQRLSNN
jgi:hypothetical protein